MEKNLISLKNLQENLSTYKKSIQQIPLVMQYNKRDLELEGIPISTVQSLEKMLNSKLKVPSFEVSALKGVNVVGTLQKIINLTVNSLSKEFAE
jgi:signal recognition particle receptor subunit beta